MMSAVACNDVPTVAADDSVLRAVSVILAVSVLSTVQRAMAQKVRASLLIAEKTYTAVQASLLELSVRGLRERFAVRIRRNLW